MQTLQRIERSWVAIGSDQQKIGSVSEVTDDFVLVKKGFIFAKDIYVPTDAVIATDPVEGTLHLNIPGAAVENMGWSTPPEVPLPPIGSAGTKLRAPLSLRGPRAPGRRSGRGLRDGARSGRRRTGSAA